MLLLTDFPPSAMRDLILVMKDGDIIEQGKHEEPLQRTASMQSLQFAVRGCNGIEKEK